MKICDNYKLPVFRTKFLKIKFCELLSNSSATFNLESVNLLNNPKLKTLTLKMELLIKKTRRFSCIFITRGKLTKLRLVVV